MPIAQPRCLQNVLAQLPLRGVLTLLFVLPTVGAVALVSYLSYRSGQSAVENLGHRLVTSTNDRVIQELKQELQPPLLINRLNVDAVHQGQLNLQNVSALESTLLSRVQQFENVSAALFVSSDGLFRLVERYPTLFLAAAEPSRPEQILVYQLDNQGKQGALVHIEIGLEVGRDRPFYATAVKTRKPGWSPIFQYGSTSDLTLNAFQPVYDRGTNQLLGVFAVHVRLTHLNEFLRELDISRAGQIIITEQNGDIVASSTGARPGPPESPKPGQKPSDRLNIHQAPDGLVRSLGQFLRNQSGSNSLKQPKLLEFSYNGQAYYAKVVPFQTQEGLNWQILTLIPKSHFMGAIQQNAQRTALLSLATLGAAIALGLLFNELLLARFKQLNQASQQLATGNLDQRLPTDRPIAELNYLAGTFNQMADQLQQSFDGIKTALATSEAKFSTIFRTSPAPTAIACLKDDRILEVNHSLVQFFGYSRDELIGRTPLELNLWSSLAQRQHFRALLQQEGQVQNLEVQLQTKAGEIRTVLLSAESRTLEGQAALILVLRDISDRKAAELALQKSEARFRELAETVSEGFFVFETATSQYSYLNPACIALTGVPKPASSEDQNYFRGMRHWLNNIHPDDRDRIEQALQQEQQGQPFEQEYRFLHPDGAMRWLRSQAYPVRDEAGAIVRIVGTVEDISNRKEAEIALQESKALFQEISQTINQVVYVVSITTRQYLYISPTYETLWGYSCESLYQDPRSWLERIHPEDIEYVSKGLDQLLSGDYVCLQYRIIGANGEIHWIESESLVVNDEAGNPLRIVGLAEDITARKRLEEALRASEEQFRRAFDDAPIGISLLSTTGQFLKANTFYCSLLGYTEAELQGLTFHDITYPPDLETDLERVEQLLSGKISTLQIEKRYLSKQGTPIPVQINAAPIRNQNGELLYIVGHIQDLRGRYQVEQMKNEFISVISHELRTPLTSIRGALGLLVSGTYKDRPEKAQHMLNIATSNSERLVRLVNDILDLERLESGKVKLVRQSCQVTDLMQQAVESVQAIADQSSIHLDLKAPDRSVWVAPDAIVQTLTNLIGNAIKFSRPGSTVWVKAEEVRQSESGISEGYILFSITDRGRGIPADKLGVIFERFQQADLSDSQRKEGTGLGLAICRNIVEQHGGQIGVESVLGEGSTFYFTVPLQGKEV